MEENKDKKEEKVKSEKIEMDSKNKDALNIFLKEGNGVFVKHVFTSECGSQLSYAEMRMIYG